MFTRKELLKKTKSYEIDTNEYRNKTTLFNNEFYDNELKYINHLFYFICFLWIISSTTLCYIWLLLR